MSVTELEPASFLFSYLVIWPHDSIKRRWVDFSIFFFSNHGIERWESGCIARKRMVFDITYVHAYSVYLI